jgi:hypothetical protein
VTNGVTNPWLPSGGVQEPAEATIASVPRATGPERPQLSVPAPDKVDQLPTRRVRESAGLWIVGAHGGAGESTIAALVDAWRPAGQAWPTLESAEPVSAVVVARTNVRGLTAAKAAAKQWASGLVPEVKLLGLVLVADAPGRLPRPLRDLSRVVSGGYPRAWQLPWVESWRLGDPIGLDAAPREVRRLVDDLNILTPNGASPGATN